MPSLLEGIVERRGSLARVLQSLRAPAAFTERQAPYSSTQPSVHVMGPSITSLISCATASSPCEPTIRMTRWSTDWATSSTAGRRTHYLYGVSQTSAAVTSTFIPRVRAACSVSRHECDVGSEPPIRERSFRTRDRSLAKTGPCRPCTLGSVVSRRFRAGVHHMSYCRASACEVTREPPGVLHRQRTCPCLIARLKRR
jgi:hypothetical protein